MIERLLGSIASFSQSRSRVLWVFVGVSALFSCYALTVTLDFSFAGVMNRSHPEVSRYFEASKAYGLGGILPLLIEGPEAELDRAVADVRAALEGLPEVRSVDREPPFEWILLNAPWVIDHQDLDAWLEDASQPPSLERAESHAQRMARLRDRLLPDAPEGARLVRIVMARDTFESALDAEDFPTIRRVVHEALARYESKGTFAGMPAIVTQEQEATIDRMAVLGPLSLVIVLAILGTVERRILMLVSIAIPMLLAVGCTLSIVGLVAGELTLMEAIFGVMVFGLGIDFALHLLMRLKEECAHGFGFEESLRRAFVGTGRGVVAGALTTSGAFFILSLAPDPVFYRLGLSGGLGLSLCLLFLLLMLPAEWAWIERRKPGTLAATVLPGRSLLGRIAGACAKHSRKILLAGAILLLSSGTLARTVQYETNLERVFSREITAVKTADRISEYFGVHSGVWVVATETLDEARSVLAKFEDEPTFSKTESVAKWIPKDVDERRRVLEAWASGSLVRGTNPSAAIAIEQESDANVELDPAALLISALRSGPPNLESLPSALRKQLIGPKGEILVLAYAEQATLDSAVAAEERQAAQTIDPKATSMNVIYEALIGTERPWLPPILIGVALFVAAIIRLDLGSFRLTALALVPALFSFMGTLGLLGIAGFSPNTVTLVAVPLLLGLAVDDGIHVVHRMLEQPDARIEEVVGSVSRSIALTTATTCGSVGLLLLSRHPGVESVAILLLVGLPLALLATVTMLPAMAVALGVRQES